MVSSKSSKQKLRQSRLPYDLFRDILDIVVADSEQTRASHHSRSTSLSLTQKHDLTQFNDKKKSKAVAVPSLCSLLLVSHGFRTHLEPLLYRAVCLDTEQKVHLFLRALESRPKVLGSYVSHLTLSIRISNLNKRKRPEYEEHDPQLKTKAAIAGVLAACYCLSSLSAHPSVLPFTLPLPPDVTLLCLPPSLHAPALATAFSSVRLLRLVVSPFTLSSIIQINLLSLTHIAVDLPRDRAHESKYLRAFLNLVRQLLRGEYIRVVAILVHCRGTRILVDTALAGCLDERLIAVELSGKDREYVESGRKSVWEVVERSICDV